MCLRCPHVSVWIPSSNFPTFICRGTCKLFVNIFYLHVKYAIYLLTLYHFQVINPKLSEIASRFGNSFGNKGRWGYSGFRGRENAGPRTQRFAGAGAMNRFKNNSTNYVDNGGTSIMNWFQFI